jgi:predicted dehydrogenase
MVAENYRYMPVVAKAADLLRQGAIGVLHAIHMQVTTYDRPTGWRLSRDLMGGGALIDGGIHLISSMRMLAGEPSRISAVAAPKIFPEMEGEEAVSLWAALPNGAVGTLNFSWAVQGETGSFACFIVGSGGYISFDFFGSSVELHCGGEKRTIPAPGDVGGLGGLLEAFLAYVGSGEPSRSTPEEATRDLALVLAAYESIRAGGLPVEIPAER